MLFSFLSDFYDSKELDSLILQTKKLPERLVFGKVGILGGREEGDLISANLADDRKETPMLVCSFMVERFWGRHRLWVSTPSGFRELG